MMRSMRWRNSWNSLRLGNEGDKRMEKIIAIFLGIVIFMKGIFWMKAGKTGIKINFILGVAAVVVGILMLGSSILSFM